MEQTGALRSTTAERLPTIIPLGGFLGSGKTTLILAAARLLQSQGLKPAAILNDQGSELVDTQFVQGNGVMADQVGGGCFCCRFSDLIDAADRLTAYNPDVIFAEAVGSCTDISATTLQPLKYSYGDQFKIAPYTVLVDPDRAQRLAEPNADADLVFLFQKQIDEGDLVCFTKADLYDSFPPLPSARYLSSLTGEGVAAWLDEVLSGQLQSGGKILDIDYERYARAEAGLAWLNCSASAHLYSPLSPAMLIGPLLDGLDEALIENGFEIAHLKLMDDTPAGYLKASLVKNGAEPNIQGMLDASPASIHQLLLNIRASGDPSVLRTITENQLAKIDGNVVTTSFQCFSPAAPKPERRMSYVVKGSN